MMDPTEARKAYRHYQATLVSAMLQDPRRNETDPDWVNGQRRHQTVDEIISNASWKAKKMVENENAFIEKFVLEK